MVKKFNDAAADGRQLVPWDCPRVEEVIEAMRAGAANATDRQKEVMHVFLNIALYSVDARVGKNWKKNMTHLNFFNNTYKFEMAIVCLLLEHFSQQGNILYNAGLTDEDGKFLQQITEPKTKKRKKMQTSKNSLKLEDSYYNFVERIEAEMLSPGYEERMAAWDSLVCDECVKRVGTATGGDTETPLVNTAPVRYLNARDAPELSAANSFLRKTGLFGAFQEIDSSGSSSIGSLSSTPESNPTGPPLTQPVEAGAVVQL